MARFLLAADRPAMDVESERFDPQAALDVRRDAEGRWQREFVDEGRMCFHSEFQAQAKPALGQP